MRSYLKHTPLINNRYYSSTFKHCRYTTLRSEEISVFQVSALDHIEEFGISHLALWMNSNMSFFLDTSEIGHRTEVRYI